MGAITLFTHLRVPKALLDMERVKAELNIVNLTYHNQIAMGYQPKATDTPSLQLWEEDGEYVILPRGYYPPWTDKRYAGFVEDLRPVWKPIELWPDFTKGLRTNQLSASRAMCTFTGPFGTGDKLLCLGCGKGKTILALFYTSILKVTTIIIVDQDFLVDQWLKRIADCYGEDSIDVGIIKGDTFTIGDHITIAMLPTLKNRLDVLDDSFYDFFGLVILDEAHVLGAPQAKKVLPNFPGERLLLTATPERKDGMHPVFMLHGGGMEPCFVDLSRDQSSEWYFVHIPQVLSDHQLDEWIDTGQGKRRRKKQLKNALFSMRAGWKRPRLVRPIYETAAGNSLEFNAQILSEVFKAYRTGRSVLVLGSRREQLTKLAEAAREQMEMDASVVISDVQGEERLKAFEARVIFAVWQIAGKALDIDRLDTLILLYPTDDIGFLRQAIGRIDRFLEGKNRSIVLAFVHTAYDSLVRKADNMKEAIREIDPGAHIRTVTRQCLLPRLQAFEE